MISFSLFGLFSLLSFMWTTAGAQTSDRVVVVPFAAATDRITLPCHIPSISSCSSINWNKTEDNGSPTVVVKAGAVTGQNAQRLDLLTDCSLVIKHPTDNDARLYWCVSGEHRSGVSLRILQVDIISTSETKDELQCFLNRLQGYVACNDTGIRIQWTFEDNTPIHGDRFSVMTHSECFSALTITKKLTDHHRKWKCQLSQNGEVKATSTYTTTVPGGIEEVFTAASESVSLPCSITSSLNGKVTWTEVAKPLTEEKDKYHVDDNLSLIISKVNATDAGDYQCSESADQNKVFNTVRLHILDVTSQCETGGDNLTLTCVLTCTEQCGQDFNLIWSGNIQSSIQSSLMSEGNTLVKKLFLPVCSTTSEITCSAQREDAVVASKTLPSVNSLQSLAWLVLPLGLLMCAAATGLYICVKRKRDKDAEKEHPSTEMIHIYEDVQDVNNEELRPQRPPNREAGTTTYSFYDLLQAVN